MNNLSYPTESDNMKATFIEATGFTESVSDMLTDQAYAKLQSLLLENPESGDVMPGCGGLRKIRLADFKRRKGKRGGCRVIYLHVPTARRIYMLDIYGKGEKEDLSANEKKQLRQLADQLKKEAIQAEERRLKENE
jgi:hypothetical protein